MLDRKNIFAVGLVSSVFVAFLIQPAQASSWDWQDSHHSRQYRHHHSYPPHGKIVVDLPGSFISVSIGRSRYYYCDGVYYRKYGFNYMVVEPPVGAVLKLPPYYEPVMINGMVYYVNNGVYYRGTAYGYELVPAPSNVAVVETARVEPQGPNYASHAFTVNVPNYTGNGCTTVVLKKSGTGFTGPQGEFYPAFPRVEDLRVMYAK